MRRMGSSACRAALLVGGGVVLSRGLVLGGPLVLAAGLSAGLLSAAVAAPPAAGKGPRQASSPACPVPVGRRQVPALQAALALQAEPEAPGQAPAGPAPGAERGNDYRQRLRPTPFGWARLDHWCVWVEPVADDGPGALWEQRWHNAIERALARWQEVLPLTRVADPAAAQVRVLRRRPPLRREATGRTRASHGRAELEVVQVDRGAGWRLEPQVQVLISPGQRPLAIEATTLHELGHAFGLWGHSDDAADAMAVVPGARPVLELSPRDRATVEWLYRQPTRFGLPLAQPLGQPLPEAAAERR